MIDLVWNPLGAISLATGALLIGLGVLLYAVGARRERNVSLAVYLVLSGLAGSSYNGARLFAADPVDAVALFVTGYAVLALGLGGYLRFVGTLDSPLVSWIRRPIVSWLVLLPLVLLAADLLVRPQAWVPGTYLFPGTASWGMRSTSLRDAFLLGIAALLVFSAAPALHAWRRAPPGILRRQAGVIAIVFSANAASNAVLIAWSVAQPGDLVEPWQALTNFLWPLLTTLAFVVGLAYGILKFQLFDVDLKIKWGLRRGTVASVFLGAFFIANSIAQQYLEGYGVIAGGAAVGLMLFLIRPLERAADRLADRAMPAVRDTPEYRGARKREVYRAAFESTSADGTLTEKERALLATLADQLGLGVKDVHDIEREARTARAGA